MSPVSVELSKGLASGPSANGNADKMVPGL